MSNTLSDLLEKARNESLHPLLFLTQKQAYITTNRERVSQEHLRVMNEINKDLSDAMTQAKAEYNRLKNTAEGEEMLNAGGELLAVSGVCDALMYDEVIERAIMDVSNGAPMLSTKKIVVVKSVFNGVDGESLRELERDVAPIEEVLFTIQTKPGVRLDTPEKLESALFYLMFARDGVRG